MSGSLAITLGLLLAGAPEPSTSAFRAFAGELGVLFQIVDDILDTGRTLVFAKDLIAARGAKRILTCVLLRKASWRAGQIEADFHAFDCPDEFMVGYGMDVAHRYRELPFVGRVIGS